MIFSSVRDAGLTLRRRPRAYRADGMTVGGNDGLYAASRPRPYPITAQQRRVRDAARTCGIRTGMGRSDLRQAMRDCIPRQFNGNGGNGGRR